VERVWAGLKDYVANTAVTWPGRARQIHAFFRNRSPRQMLDAAAPWTSPWLPAGYEQNFWNAALAAFATCDRIGGPKGGRLAVIGSRVTRCRVSGR